MKRGAPSRIRDARSGIYIIALTCTPAALNRYAAACRSKMHPDRPSFVRTVAGAASRARVDVAFLPPGATGRGAPNPHDRGVMRGGCCRRRCRSCLARVRDGCFSAAIGRYPNIGTPESSRAGGETGVAGAVTEAASRACAMAAAARMIRTDAVLVSDSPSQPSRRSSALITALTPFATV